MNFDLDGKVAIVTGGTRGLGLSIARSLAEAGCEVTVCARSEPSSLPKGVSFHEADIRDTKQVDTLIKDVVSWHGSLDILVNNAGGSPASNAATASTRFADKIMSLNLMAPYYLARACHPHMKKAGGGSIVNIASVAGIRPSPGTAIYGAAKAGLLSLTQSLAQEWGKDNIRVNAIVVGLAKTENTKATYGDQAAQDKVAASLPLGRMAAGNDVAQAALYLCSTAAEYISGAKLNVDGGGEKPYFLDLVKGD